MNGTVFIVTDEPKTVPDRWLMISTGVNIDNGKEAEEARIPSDKEMRIISKKEAKILFGAQAEILDGVTVSIVVHMHDHQLTNVGTAVVCK